MRTLILICILLMFSFSTSDVPETCYCTFEKQSWTAFCGERLTCEKCCEKTKPKPKEKKKKKKKKKKDE